MSPIELLLTSTWGWEFFFNDHMYRQLKKIMGRPSDPAVAIFMVIIKVNISIIQKRVMYFCHVNGAPLIIFRLCMAMYVCMCVCIYVTFMDMH